MTAEPNCSRCKFALLEDYGYSNYTVEGTNFTCMRKLHPDGTFDKYYGGAPGLEYAKQCFSFIEGEPIEIDVEEENLAELTPEQRTLIREMELHKRLLNEQ